MEDAPRQTALAQELLAQLRTVADPDRALGMQAYMKSEMPYLGLSAVPLRQVCKRVFAGLAWDNTAAWQADVLAIWRGARFREERYGAIELSGIKSARPFQHLDALPMYEEMIVSGAWWDHVDAIAGHRLWAILENEGEPMKRAIRAWSTDPDMWKRRSSIISQLRAKERTDLDLLYACIEPSLGSKEFFLRKAIGWALRQYAWTDPVEVQRYVAANADRLSGLSQREALKNVNNAA